MLGFIVVGNPAATVITSSPFLIALSPNFGEVSVLNATKFADEPEFVVIKFFTFRKFESFFSNFSLNLPVVSHPSNDASIIFLASSLPITFPVIGTTLKSVFFSLFSINWSARFKICFKISVFFDILIN